ncbi:MAG: 3-phosphoserine/phosphohydroxythreonine transaminase [Cryomorphaceae bacterium]|nr:3-phosphoserine/phosphohydroxythreonine transaminase [Cryomorphaceae bacterium]MBT6729190.1 3-phosphoserine/phosphohydroxythreonine transaminase [Cryomorphaceae bacterium]
MNKKVHNFSAGPSILPDEVFQEASSAIKNFNNSGLSILEISHRSKDFMEVLEEARSTALDIAELNKDEYSCLFLQGGASLQFLMTAYNFLNHNAAYINTGSWSSKAMKEAKMFGNVSEIGSSADKNFNYIPKDLSLNESFDYLHLTSNNTIFGTQFHSFPDSEYPLFADMSSDIFSRKINFSKFDLIYAGAQKNLGPAGVTMVLIKKSLFKKITREVPSMLSYKIHVDKDSSFNTPPVFPIYCVLLNLRMIKNDGLDNIGRNNNLKSDLIYKEIDTNKCFSGFSNVDDRSQMNATFNLNDGFNGDLFNEICKENNISGINGHRSVGGYRASIYNALPLDSINLLIKCMKEFESNYN